MKKMLLIGAVSVYNFGFGWNALAGAFKKTVNTLAYTIESSGTNPRVYEFDTQGKPRLHCVVLFRDNEKTSPAMQCVSTNESNIKFNSKK